MTLTPEQVALLLAVVGIACVILAWLETHSRLRKTQLMYRASENRVALLELEIGRLTRTNKYQGPNKPSYEQPEGATYELCKKTGNWRVT
uniref:Uncharacterized protein n=1 Tax=Pseudomonas phage HRDY3 TaxID=3236930 RepID=A0AB39CEJ7_9VIRU